MKKIDTNSYSVVGGVLHPFNYAASPDAYQACIDSIAKRFPNQCKTVRAVIQETLCNSLVPSIPQFFNNPNSESRLLPNPTDGIVYVHITSDRCQFVEAAVYNLQGQKLKLFYSGYMPKGKYTFWFSSNDLSMSTYYVRISKEKSEEILHFKK